MALKFVDRARMSVSGTPGTGSITLGSAQSGYQSFATAGIANGDTSYYLIEDGTSWEIGLGTYTSSGTVWARTTCLSSSAGGTTKITATSAAIVSLVMIGPMYGAMTPDTIAPVTSGTFPNTGLKIKDTDASHNLILKAGSNLSASDKTLTLTTGNADVEIDLTDAGADALMFWDDSASVWRYLSLAVAPAISILGTSLRVIETMCIACSDEVNTIAAATGKAFWVWPYAVTIVEVYASLNTGPTTTAMVIDINEAGTTIMSGTKLTIAAAALDSSASGHSVTDSSIAAYAKMSVDVDSTGTGAKGLKVYITYYRST